MLRTAIFAFRSDSVKKILDTASVLDTYLITLYASLDCLQSLENNKKSIAAKRPFFNLLCPTPNGKQIRETQFSMLPFRKHLLITAAK